MNSLLKVFFFALACCLPQMGSACSDAYVLDWGPSQNAKNCSFGSYGLDGNYSGDKAIDIGRGKIRQLLVEKLSCPYVEKLLFVDCLTVESVTVDGRLQPELQQKIDDDGLVILGGDYLIKYIQPPFGSLDVSKNSTVKSVVAASEDHGLTYTTAILQSFAENNAAILEHEEWVATMMGSGEDQERWLQESEIVQRAKSGLADKPFDLMCGCKRFYPDSAGAKS